MSQRNFKIVSDAGRSLKIWGNTTCASGNHDHLPEKQNLITSFLNVRIRRGGFTSYQL
jgi:hypothetical protein